MEGGFTKIEVCDSSLALRREPTGDVGEKVSPAILRRFVPIGITQGGHQKAKHTNAVDAPPSFVNSSSGDFHIRQDSAANGAGVVTFVAHDFEGDIRPCQGKVDLGADQNCAPLQVYLPIVIRDSPG